MKAHKEGSAAAKRAYAKAKPGQVLRTRERAVVNGKNTLVTVRRRKGPTPGFGPKKKIRLLVPVYVSIPAWAYDDLMTTKEMGEHIIEAIAESYPHPEYLAFGHVRRAPARDRPKVRQRRG